MGIIDIKIYGINMEYFHTARINMVKNQVMPNHVNDNKLIEAMMNVPRHQFLDNEFQNIAYIDSALPLEDGRKMLQPELLARMIQALELKGEERVMDVACGSGYSTALLSKLAGQVVAVESITQLATKAINHLSYLQIQNVTIKNNNLLGGDPKNAPFDAILINGAVDRAPKALINQLADGGKLVCVMHQKKAVDKVVMFVKTIDGNVSHIELFDGTAELLTQ